MIIVSAVYVVCLGVVAFIQCRRLWSDRDKRETLICALSITVSAAVGALLIAGMDVPTFVLPYKVVFEPIGKSILSP